MCVLEGPHFKCTPSYTNRTIRTRATRHSETRIAILTAHARAPRGLPFHPAGANAPREAADPTNKSTGSRGPRVKDDKVLIVSKFPRLCADMRELSRESENSAQKDGLRAGLRVCVDNTGFARMLQVRGGLRVKCGWGARAHLRPLE